MSLSIQNSTQFIVRDCSILTKAGIVDIKTMFDEISLYDSMFIPVSSGKILVTDSVGLHGKLFFDGSEAILLEISKGMSDVGRIKKAYRIYKSSDRQNVNLNTQRYILHFVADELLYSSQIKVHQSYDMKYSDMVKKIMVDYLKSPNTELGGYFEDSMGVRNIVIPGMSPLDAIMWCSKKAVDKNNSPNFLFYQNNIGFNFVTLSTLLPKESILDIRIEAKNLKSNNPLQEMSSARSIEHIQSVDALEKILSGVDSGKFIGVDPMTRTVASRHISFNDHYGNMSHGGDTPNASVDSNRGNVNNLESFDSKYVLSGFGTAKKYSKYVKKYDPSSISKEDDTENYKFQRAAILKNLINKRLRLVMPGNFQLTSGMNVEINLPNFGARFSGGEYIDPSISGKYIIVASRQIIGYNKHDTIIEVASTSSNLGFIPESGQDQYKNIAGYNE